MSEVSLRNAKGRPWVGPWTSNVVLGTADAAVLTGAIIAAFEGLAPLAVVGGIVYGAVLRVGWVNWWSFWDRINRAGAMRALRKKRLAVHSVTQWEEGKYGYASGRCVAVAGGDVKACAHLEVIRRKLAGGGRLGRWNTVLLQEGSPVRVESNSVTVVVDLASAWIVADWKPDEALSRFGRNDELLAESEVRNGEEILVIGKLRRGVDPQQPRMDRMLTNSWEFVVSGSEVPIVLAGDARRRFLESLSSES